MKKRFALLFSLLLVFSLLALCAGCSQPAAAPESVPAAAASGSSAQPEPAPPADEPAPASGRNTALDAAFAAGDTFRLVPADLPSGDLGENRMAVGLSPDGRTVLWKTWETGENGQKVYSLSLVRNGETIPVTFNPERGAGDPHGKAPYIAEALRDLPGTEGFSWSEDGRYVALSFTAFAISRTEGPDVAVIDTASGDLYLAAAHRDGREAIQDGSFTGLVILNRIDRSGQYCYYLLMTKDSYRFCRCPAEGGAEEILYETKRDDSQPFGITTRSSLTETTDGSWLLTGLNGRETDKTVRNSLIRFSSAGDTWSAAVTPVGIPYSGWNAGFSTSSVSGYSIAVMQNPASGQSMALAQTSTAAATDLQKASIMPALFLRVNMLRVLPGEEQQHDIWWLQETEENNGIPEARPGEPFLLVYKTMHSQLTDDDAEELLKWSPEIDPETGFPAGYDQLSDQRGESGFRHITHLCLSPDGYYCLAVADDGKGQERPWLVSLETMEVRKVDMPESLDLRGLGSNFILSYYYPQMTWNDDGTLLILNTATQRTESFRLEFGSDAAE